MFDYGWRLRTPLHPAVSDAVTAAGWIVLDEVAAWDGPVGEGLGLAHLIDNAAGVAAARLWEQLPEIVEAFGGERWSTLTACRALAAAVRVRLLRLAEALDDVESAQEHAAVRRQWFAGQLRDGG